MSKEIFEFFSIKYIVETEEKPLRIYLKWAYGTINTGLWNEKFVKLENEPKTEEKFHVIRNKINKVQGADNIFVAYSKIKIKILDEQKFKLRITNCFAEMNVCFRKAIIKSKNVYFIHVNVDKAKILNI